MCWKSYTRNKIHYRLPAETFKNTFSLGLCEFFNVVTSSALCNGICRLTVSEDLRCRGPQKARRHNVPFKSNNFGKSKGCIRFHINTDIMFVYFKQTKHCILKNLECTGWCGRLERNFLTSHLGIQWRNERFHKTIFARIL